MGGCFPCFGSSNKEGSGGVSAVKEGSAKKESVKEGLVPQSHHVGRVSSDKSKRNSSDPKKEPPIPKDGPTAHIVAQTFTFRELAAATKNFRPECLLEDGGYGRVYKGHLASTGQVVAVKQLDRNGLPGNRDFLVEVLMLSLLHHPNLVNLIGYCADGDQRLLVYEFMPLGSLEDHLHDKSKRNSSYPKKKPPIPKDGPTAHIAAQTFTFRELAAATKNFRPECLLGEGGYGRVYKGRLESTGQINPSETVLILRRSRQFLKMDQLLILLHKHLHFENLLLQQKISDQSTYWEKGVMDLESTGQVVAVKQLYRNGLQGNRDFLVEVLMLCLLHHPNLVNLIGYCADGDQRLLVYDFMPQGSYKSTSVEIDSLR